VVDDQAYARLAPKVLAALAGRSLTVTELRKTLGAEAELSGVVAMVCDEGRIVRGQPVGSRNSSMFRYRVWADAFPDVALDDWDETAATRELVRLYLDSYGPVSRADVIWWTGLPARRVYDAIYELGDEVVIVSVAGLDDRLLMTPGALEEMAAIQPGPLAVNLLPMLDP
jgi:Winged helix DNA-binding domain